MKRAFTIPEVLITSTLLLLLIGMASICIVSFVRGYQKFDQESAKTRTQLTTLDRLSSHLRSAKSLQKLEPLQITVQTAKTLEKEDISVENGQLYLKTDHNKTSLGPAQNLQLEWRKDGLLYVNLDNHLAVIDWAELLP